MRRRRAASSPDRWVASFIQQLAEVRIQESPRRVQLPPQCLEGVPVRVQAPQVARVRRCVSCPSGAARRGSGRWPPPPGTAGGDPGARYMCTEMVALSRPQNGDSHRSSAATWRYSSGNSDRQALALQPLPDLAQAVRAALGGQGVLHLLEADQAGAGEDPVGRAAPAALAAGAGAEPVQRRACDAGHTRPAWQTSQNPRLSTATSASQERSRSRCLGGRRRRAGRCPGTSSAPGRCGGTRGTRSGGARRPGAGDRPGILQGHRAADLVQAVGGAQLHPHRRDHAQAAERHRRRPGTARRRARAPASTCRRWPAPAPAASARLATQPRRVPVPCVAVASTPPSDWASTSPWFSRARPCGGQQRAEIAQARAGADGGLLALAVHRRPGRPGRPAAASPDRWRPAG